MPMMVDRQPELYNLEAEQGLLGIILIENHRIWDVADIITKEDFYSNVHGEIYQDCLDMIRDNKQASPTLLAPKYKTHPELEAVSGKGNGNVYLVDLMMGVISKLNTKDYAESISDFAQRRRLLDVVNMIRDRIPDTDTQASEIVSDAIKNFAEKMPTNAAIKTKRQVAKEAIDALELPPACYSTGMRPLDMAMGGGMYQGFTYGIAGQEKRGKTTLAHTISSNLNDNGVLHAYIALEMGARQIEQRNIARKVGFNSLKFMQESTRDDKRLMREISEAATNCPDNTLYLDMAGATLAMIQMELNRLITRYKIKGFVLDYWQLVGGCPKHQTKSDFWYEVAQWVANFARKHGLFCILLAQVNRDGGIFGSSGLEKACDQLYQIELANENGLRRDIWLKMTHTRYTMLGDVGSESAPLLTTNTTHGPFIEEL